MPTNEYSRADFLRALLNQQRRNTAMGGSLLNPSVSNDLAQSASLDTTFQGNTPINGAVANFDVDKYKTEQKQAGHTGNWFVDGMDNIFGFVDEIAAKFGAGFVGAWEGILDLGATAIGAFGDWTGWYDSNPFTKWAQQDIGTAAAEWTKTYMNLNPWSWIRKSADGTFSNEQYWKEMFGGASDILDSALFFSNELHDFREDSNKYYRYNDETLQDMGQAGEFIGGAAHSIGFMLPSIITGGVAGAGTKAAQAISLGSMGLMAAGKGSEEALNEGANASQALGYGAASGAVEVVSEIAVGKVLGLAGLGTGKIMGVVGSGSTKTAVKVGSNAFIKELGKTMFEEGMEEVFSAVLEPVTKSIYKGKDAFKGTYSNPDWWFGTNGHFNESVVGQFTSGAFVGGLSGGVQTAPVYKKLGATNYNTMSSFREVVEIDGQMAQMEKQRGFDKNSKAYQKLVNERAEAMSKFIQNMDKSMKGSTTTQNKYLLELLTNKGALEKAIKENSDVDVAVNDYLKKVESGYSTHERSITTSFFNEMQARYGTNYELEYLSPDEIVKQYGKQGADAETKGFFDSKSNKIVLNDSMIETNAGKVLAHEYFAHGIAKTMSGGNVRTMFNSIISTEAGKSVAKRLRESTNYNFKDVPNSNRAFQEEVLGHFLEESFDGKNLATQLNQIKKQFGESKLDRFIDNILDAFNKTEKFRSNKVAEEYAKVLNQWLKYGENNKNITSKTIRKIVYKEYNGVELNSFEKSVKSKYSKLVDILENQIGDEIHQELNRLEPQLAFSKDIDGNIYKIMYDENGKPFFRSPFSYEGNKYELLPDLMPAFPNKKTFKGNFIEAFAGSAVVSANADYKNQTANELNPYTFGVLKAFKEMSTKDIMDYVFKTIDDYQLRTQEGFDKFKEKFNKTKPSKRNALDLFILQKASSSGSMLWFDENGNFKGNFVRGNFLANKSRVREEISKYHNGLQNVNLTNKDAIAVIDEAKSGDFIYVDPPYTNTNATYNAGWTEADDTRLMEALDRATRRGVGFALSNVFEYNGKTNENWKKWATEGENKYLYSVQHLDKSYFKGKADEILIKFEGEYANEEYDTEYNWYRSQENKGRRYSKVPEEIFNRSQIYSEKWRNNLSPDRRRRATARLEAIEKLYSAKSSMFGEAIQDDTALDHFYIMMDDLNKEGKVHVLDKQGCIKPEFWTPEMHLLNEEYKKLGGASVEFELYDNPNYTTYFRPSSHKIRINIYGVFSTNETPIKVIRHERLHYFQHDNPNFYHEYFEKYMDDLFTQNPKLLNDLRAADPHGSYYYDFAVTKLSLGQYDSILEEINVYRQRRGLNPYTEQEIKNMLIDDVAFEYNRSSIYDEILADTFSLMGRVQRIYGQHNIDIRDLIALSNRFRDAINKRYNTEIMFSKSIGGKSTAKKSSTTNTFKDIRTTEDIVVESSDYIENVLGSGYKVHYPDNYRNFSSKAFTEINGVQRVKAQARHLANILLDTQITENNKVVGTLDELFSPSDKKNLETMLTAIISSAPDTTARSKATLPFEKALNRAVRNVQDSKTLAGRAHVWQNLRNSIHNQYDRYLDLTDDSVAKGGYQPLLNIFNETHWNGTSSYKLGSLRETVEAALELYTEDSIKKNFGGLQYSPAIHDALLDLEASLPARKQITTKTGVKTTRDVSLDDNTIQKLIDLGRLVKKQIQNQIERDATEIRPAVREGVKAIEDMSYSQRKNIAARMFRAWKRGFAPAYVVLEQMLGSNSTLSRKITYEMQMGFNRKQLYTGAYSDLINNKLKELGIKKTFDKRTFDIDGHKLTADQALSLYISLQVDINKEEINNNGFQYILPESGKEMKLSSKLGVGEADALKEKVEKTLPENYRKFGDFLLETMNGSVKAEYMRMYEKKFGKYNGRNEIGKIGDKSYWMLFRSYQKATNVEKSMKNPAGVFTHARARVDTQNAVLINGALSSFTSYVDSLGSELYVKPIYRDVISILNTKTEQGVNGRTLSQVLAEKVGEKDFNYLMTSLADMLGVNPKINDMFSRAMSTFSVAKLSLNIGTMLKQFASIWTSNIPMYKSVKGVFSNIFKNDAVKAEYKQLIDGVKKEDGTWEFEPIGGLKYRESSKGVLTANADTVGAMGQKIAKVGMWGISKVDLFTVSSGVVSLMHIAEDQYGYKIGTKENRDWVKEHWTEFELSQIGNSALSKNAVARGDFGGITKAVFGFLQGANRAALGSQLHKLGLWARNRNVDIKSLEKQLKSAKDRFTYASDEYKLNPNDDDVREEYINAKAEYDHLQNQAKDYESYRAAGGKAIPVNTACGLLAQGIFISLINELMRHIKGKEDWDEWSFEDISVWALNILKATFFDWMPFVNTITSALGGSFERDEEGNIKIGKGYDVQVPAVEIAGDMVDLFNGFKEGKVNWFTILNIVGNVTGVPVATLSSYAYGTIKLFDPVIASEMQDLLYGYNSAKSYKTLNAYVDKGDYTSVKKVINGIMISQRTGNVSERTLNELSKLYMSGYNALPRETMAEYTNEKGETVQLTAAQITAFKNIYQQSDKAVRDLMQVQEYQSLTQEEQAKLIKKIYDIYYDYAKVKVVGGSGNTKLSNLLAMVNGNLNLGNLVAILNKVSQITDNKRKTRKELVVEYINRQVGLSRQEKVLAMYLAGYGLNDKNKRTVKGFLAGRGVNAENIKAFLGL